MPVNIMIGLVALLVALALYTIGVWKAFRAKRATKTSIRLIWIGFGFDVIATAMMAIQARGLVNDLHTYLAFVGLFGMLIAAALGTWAMTKGNDAILAGISRWVLVPWAVWVFVFVWGMVERGSQRMG